MPRSKVSQLPGDHIHQVRTVLTANGTPEEFAVFQNNTGAPIRITGIGFLPDAAVTGVVTNNFSLQGKSKTVAGAAKKDVTAVKTFASGTDMVAFVLNALVLATAATDRDLLNGESLTLNKAENGVGLTLPAGAVVISYEFRG